MQDGEGSQTQICYDVKVRNNETGYGIIVVSSNGATAGTDVKVLANVQDVQNRSVTFFVTYSGVNSCNRKLAIISRYVRFSLGVGFVLRVVHSNICRWHERTA